MKQAMEHGKIQLSGGLPTSDISRIQGSFRLIASEGAQIVSRFYALLFERFPDLQSFFHPANMSQQHDQFLNGLGTLVFHLEHPQELRAILIQLGERHQRYGIETQHYPPVLDTFLHVLEEFGGEGMDGKTYEAWANFLQLVRAIMLESYSMDRPAEGQDGKSGPTLTSDSTKRILLIDDDRHLLDLYQSYLEGQGYLCSQVSDVAWALTHLQMCHYDLVLTDFQMPVMNGIQVRETYANENNDVSPPFLLITGSLNQEIRKKAQDAGFVAVLRKPHNLMELGGIISTILKKSCGFLGNEIASNQKQAHP